MDDVPREVIGVLPATFHFPNANSLRSMQSQQPVSGISEPAVFFPVALDVTQFDWNGNFGNWIVIGRLKPGTTVGNAEAELNTITAQMVREMPANEGERRPGALLAYVQPMQEAVVGDSRVGLWLLMAAVVGLMLIACLNLANAQLGRALSRKRESACAQHLALQSGGWFGTLLRKVCCCQSSAARRELQLPSARWICFGASRPSMCRACRRSH